MELTNDLNNQLILPGILDNFNQSISEDVFLPGILDDVIETSSDLDSSVYLYDKIDNSPNCLSLTVVPDYNMISIKNLIFHSAQITYKILFSTVILNLIKLFI